MDQAVIAELVRQAPSAVAILVVVGLFLKFMRAMGSDMTEALRENSSVISELRVELRNGRAKR